jgi:hypothetical protein
VAGQPGLVETGQVEKGDEGMRYRPNSSGGKPIFCHCP